MVTLGLKITTCSKNSEQGPAAAGLLSLGVPAGKLLTSWKTWQPPQFGGRSEFESQRLHSFAVRLWASQLTSLSLHFLPAKWR